MRDLAIRTATGVVFVAVVLAAMLFGRLSFAVLLVCITIGCMWEFYRLAEKSGGEGVAERVSPHRWLGIIIGVLIVGVNLTVVEAVSNSFFNSVTAYAVVAVVALALISMLIAAVFIVEIWRRKPSPIANLGATFLGVAYVALPVSLIAYFPIVGHAAGEWNARIAPAFALIVWANDVFAYLVGITLGRSGKHKMCERLSPAKTWEGFVGGIAGAIIVATTIGLFFVDDNVWFWICLGALTSLAAVAGDFVESNFKRSVGVKDSGRLLPGHGGLLDRFDAMLLSAPFVFVFFIIALLLGGIQG